MIVKLLTEQHLEFLSLKGGCTGSSESTLVKISHCWKSHVTSHICMAWPWNCGTRILMKPSNHLLTEKATLYSAILFVNLDS